ncbi:MAG: hypothetical protein VX341_02485 [Bdellovibrionota bacterium]|nr:hypothetical protein [Bdellovibrionota bacterium]|tara:strand:+ start:680 stop:934 length:255 start_codon:yes stop_codon:yes gene_type:complete
MKKMTFVTILISILYVCSISAKEKVIYKYKTYESFDLGNLEIKGEVIAPGDLSAGDRAPKQFSENLFERKNFKDFYLKEIRQLR